MLDKKRILTKLDELDSYLTELRQVLPKKYNDYKSSIEKKRASERLIHISIESTIDICNLVVSGLKLGAISEEEDLFKKLEEGKIMSGAMVRKLRRLKAFRNILIHRYGHVSDRIVFENLKTRPKDFESFKKEILALLEQGRSH